MKESIKKILTSILSVIVLTAIVLVPSFMYKNKSGTNKSAGISNKTVNNIQTEEQQEEHNNTIKKNIYGYVEKKTPVLVVASILSIVIFVISYIINKHKKIKKYRTETDGVVSPILAEAIIDKKIGLKELIMTTIIDLSIRGNIKIINNDVLELISMDNLEQYEIEIVKLLFVNRTIKISDINNIFVKSNFKTMEFTRKLNKIRKLLKRKLLEMDLFSKKLTEVNGLIRLIALLICINLPITMMVFYYSSYQLCIYASIFVIIVYLNKNKKQSTTKEEVMNMSREF